MLKKIIFPCLFITTIFSLSSQISADRYTLSVVIRGIRNNNGQLIVALFNEESKWLDNNKAYRIQTLAAPAPGFVVVEFNDLPADNYAVSIIHDENENGKMDMWWLPPSPNEGTAVSNNVMPGFGPPSYQDSLIEINSWRELTLNIIYF